MLRSWSLDECRITNAMALPKFSGHIDMDDVSAYGKDKQRGARCYDPTDKAYQAFAQNCRE